MKIYAARLYFKLVPLFPFAIRYSMGHRLLNVCFRIRLAAGDYNEMGKH